MDGIYNDGSPIWIRTRDHGVKVRCLNHLAIGLFIRKKTTAFKKVIVVTKLTKHDTS